MGTSAKYSNEKTKFGEITAYARKRTAQYFYLEGQPREKHKQFRPKERKGLTDIKKELRKSGKKELNDMCAKVSRE